MSQVGGVTPLFMDKANQKPDFADYHYRGMVKCVSVLTPPIPPRGTPSVAGVDTLNHPTFVTCREELKIHKKS